MSRKLIIFATLALALAAPASATGWGDRNTNTNINRMGQAQGQAQGQIQGQGQLQGQNQSVSNDVNVEGSVGVSMGAANCAAGVGLGIPGAGSFGISWTVESCRILAEAQQLYSMGFHSLAISHLTQIDRVANTVRAVQGSGATVVSSRAAPSTPSAPSVALEVNCVRTEAGIQPQVTQAVMDAYTTAEIMSVCQR